MIAVASLSILLIGDPLQPVPVSRFADDAVTNFFAAVAMDDLGNSSDLSNIVSLENTNRLQHVTLAWDPSPSTCVANYRIFQWTDHGTQTNSWDAGTNLQLTVPTMPLMLSNVVVRVTTASADLIYYQNLGPIEFWKRLGTNVWQGTNPTTMFWRGMGSTNRVCITNWLQ